MLYTLKNLMEYVQLLFLKMNLHDCFYIHQSFLLSDFWYLLHSNILVPSENILLQKSLFWNTVLWDSHFFLLEKTEDNSDNKKFCGIFTLLLLMMLIIFYYKIMLSFFIWNPSSFQLYLFMKGLTFVIVSVFFSYFFVI